MGGGGSYGADQRSLASAGAEAMLAQFPFRILGFHSDNGSEFINHNVAKLLNKLLIEQTKSRPRHCNDNGLAESKNGWVIRKHIGFGHIASPHAAAFDQFYREHFNPYLNFHRPCGVPEGVEQRPRQAEAGVSLVCDAVGDFAASARRGRLPAPRSNGGPTRSDRGGEIRYASRDGDAAGQEKAVDSTPTSAETRRTW